MNRLLIITLCLLVAACTSTGRYTQRNDSKPERISSDISFENAAPRYEPYAPANLRPYTVLGRQYVPLKTAKGYSATGVASWYGQKFHGHDTANGEEYDMFSMSAAHKTLPLPSFVRVTNLDNGRQAVVRVNDRGPFHGNRIIDLSYAAALKLGVTSTGTARVKLDVIHVDEDGLVSIGNGPVLPEANDTNKRLYIQVAALQDKARADKLAQGLAMLYQTGTALPNDNGIYRLRLGPLDDEAHAASLLEELKNNGYDGAYKLYVAP